MATRNRVGEADQKGTLGVPADTVMEGGQQASLTALRWLVVLSVLLPLLAYGLAGAVRYQQIHAETELRLVRSLRVAQEHALKVFETNESILSRVAERLGTLSPEAIEQQGAQLHEQLKALSHNKPQIQSIWVIGPQGGALVTDRFYPSVSTNFSDRSYFQWHAAARGGVFISELLVGRLTKTPFFDMSVGRYGPDGTFLGVISVSMTPTYFEQVHRELVTDEPGMAINLLREDGVIFSRSPKLASAPAALAPGSPVMQLIRSGETAGTLQGISSVDQRDRLLVFAKVGHYPVYLGCGMAVSEIRRRWLVEMSWLGAFGLPPLFALFVVARLALRRTRDSLDAAEQLNREMRARQRVEEALLQAQKLEALGRLTGGVAHDFNNALMVITNNLMLLKHKYPQANGSHLESISRAVAASAKLTRQLLAFSRRQALVPERIELQQRLPACQDLLTPVLGGRVACSISVAADTAPIVADAAELELSLINLAINARDAMPEGGNFDLQASNAPVPPPGFDEGRGWVMLQARDSGQGIDSNVLQKVFEPFFTTKPVGEGTGLGLSQVYGLCQRAGGTATIESELGQGTTVRLYFPVAGDEPAAPEVAPTARQLPTGCRVLLVEDNGEVAVVVQQVLQTLGCQVTHQPRAQAALHWLQTQDALPDAVLSDVIMPGEMDGAGLAQRLKQLYPQLPVVLMTGYSQQIDSLTQLGLPVLPKPCTADMLADALSQAIRGKHKADANEARKKT